MSEDHNKLNVTRWLSDLQSPHLTPTRPKRKHKSSNKESIRSSKRHCASQIPGRVVFAQVDSNTMPAPTNQKGVTLEKAPLRKSSRTPSPTKKHLNIMPMAPPKTPQNNVTSKRTKPLYTPVHRPPESPPSSEDTDLNHVEFTPCASQRSNTAKGSVSTKSSTSFSVKIAKNVRNIRDSLGEEGFYFEDEESYEKHPGLQQEVERIFCRERGSAMRTESLRAIKQWRKENSTAPEDGYYSKLLPKIVKDSRSTFGDIAAYVTKSFQSDELHEATKAVLNRNILYRHRENIEKKLGLTNPVPDHLWGLKIPHNPPRNAPRINTAATALIKLGGDVRWAGFAMEDKSADDPIEAAENQAIRSGAALVESRRQLKALARKPGGTEAVGVDVECIAFSCSWVPQLANIHVHWYELTEEGHSIWHMNWLEGYRFSKDADMKQFRHDIHNILDWVCGHERKKKIRELEIRLAASGSIMNE